jgi:hypothetical protein
VRSTAARVPGAVEAPQLGPLVLRVPLPELVAEGVDALLRAGLLLVAPRPAEDGVEVVRVNGVEQRGGPQLVARAVGALAHTAGVDGLLDARDEQAHAELGGPAVAELQHLGEVVPGVDVQERERDARRRKGLLRQPQHDDRVLAAGEQQRRPLELRPSRGSTIRTRLLVSRTGSSGACSDRTASSGRCAQGGGEVLLGAAVAPVPAVREVGAGLLLADAEEQLAGGGRERGGELVTARRARAPSCAPLPAG